MALEIVNTDSSLIRDTVSVNKNIAEALSFSDAGSAWKEMQRLREDPVASLDIKNGLLLSELHQRLSSLFVPTAASYRHNGKVVEEVPYWEIKERENDYFQMAVGTQTIQSGALEQFPIGTRALIVDTAARIYSQELLRLDEWAREIYPNDLSKAEIWKQLKEIELVTTMSHEFRSDHVIALALENKLGSPIIVGSIGAIHGCGDRPIKDTVGYDGISRSPASSVPTNFALDFPITPGLEEKIGGVSESQVAEITRLWKVPSPREDIDTRTVSLSLYASIPEGIAKNMPEVSHLIFNTKEGLHKMLVKLGYPVTVLTQGNIMPTLGIMTTIHGRYYVQAAQKESISTERIAIPQILHLDDTLQVSRKIQAQLKQR